MTDQRVSEILRALPAGSQEELAEAHRYCRAKLSRAIRELLIARLLFWSFIGAHFVLIAWLSMGAAVLLHRELGDSWFWLVSLSGMLLFFGLLHLAETHEGLNSTAKRLEANAQAWGEDVHALKDVVTLLKGAAGKTAHE